MDFQRLPIHFFIGTLISLFSGLSAHSASLSPSTLISSATSADSLNAEQIYNFDTDEVGTAPAGFVVIRGNWIVRTDAHAPSRKHVLMQTGEIGAGALIVVRHAHIKDGVIEVWIRPGTRPPDQAAGVVFRYQDPENFYLLQLDARESLATLFKNVQGVLSGITYKRGAISAAGWTKLRIELKGPQIACFLDDDELLTAQHDLFTDGEVGLWAKSQSPTAFDNLRLTAQ